jgi:hypothetical protein
MPNARNSELGKAKEMILVYTTPYLISVGELNGI